MSQTANKDSRLHIRCDERTRQLLDKAAERIVQEQESITLRVEDFHTFLAALDAPDPPDPPNTALLPAVERHAEQVGRS
jgi:uncharacterized protein (DUF1778 family)